MIRAKRHVTRIGKRNQVTLPVQILRDIGLGPGEAVEVAEMEDGSVRIRKATDAVDRAFGLLKRAHERPTGKSWWEIESDSKRERMESAAADDERILRGE